MVEDVEGGFGQKSLQHAAEPLEPNPAGLTRRRHVPMKVCSLEDIVVVELTIERCDLSLALKNLRTAGDEVMLISKLGKLRALGPITATPRSWQGLR